MALAPRRALLGSGVVPGLAYAADVSSSAAVAFTAQYKFSFKDTIVTGVLDQRTLIVETFNHFTDGSGRSDSLLEGLPLPRQDDRERLRSTRLTPQAS